MRSCGGAGRRKVAMSTDEAVWLSQLLTRVWGWQALQQGTRDVPGNVVGLHCLDGTGQSWPVTVWVERLHLWLHDVERC